ncbi:hypothetical protein C6988_00885 [Nitrosopumilus sp. b1]|uniref:cytidylyltransferase domain-containing protein n=1 Tax=Nitrosopumilus sp. b1 TaxID=2109907 RepID=UPI0015F72825|nr:glycosyltransferase family protein [Nitrosopumilus sp. b1]KAF6243996.1 hypothetical protein C6988_00885 [Nitrosopumilus sp. b1]
MTKKVFIGVIQARMASSRLPSKIMQDILGKPLILHIYERLRKIPQLSQVVLATTNQDSDEPLQKFAIKEKISFYAGSVNDILDRLYNTGNKFKCDFMLKINADCPLIDTKLIEEGIKKVMLENKKIDLLTNCVTDTFPEGMQFAIFNFDTIKKLNDSVKEPFWREYIFRYFIENKNKFNIINIENQTDLSSLRWTVDYKEDLEFVKKIYENLYPRDPFFGMIDILDFLKKNPQISAINSMYSAKIGINEFNRRKKNS